MHLGAEGRCTAAVSRRFRRGAGIFAPPRADGDGGARYTAARDMPNARAACLRHNRGLTKATQIVLLSTRKRVYKLLTEYVSP